MDRPKIKPRVRVIVEANRGGYEFMRDALESLGLDVQPFYATRRCPFPWNDEGDGDDEANT